MNRIAILPTEKRLELFVETATQLGSLPFHREKDFWVCWVLEALFRDAEVGPHLTFLR